MYAGSRRADGIDWKQRQTAYAYDDAGRLAQIADPNGVRSALSYDVADRLTGIAHAKGGTSPEAIAYQLDPAGNWTQMADSAGTTTWGHDAADGVGDGHVRLAQGRRRTDVKLECADRDGFLASASSRPRSPRAVER